MKNKASLFVTLALCGLGFGACDNTAFPATCSDIPAGGCPEDNGAEVCTDCTCQSVYACDNGKWVFDKDCPPNPCPEAGVTSDAAVEEAAPGDVTTTDVGFVIPPGAYGGPGCTDLETPDCSLGTALACANTPDCCDCGDLWVCQDGGWVSWGSCTASGTIVPNKP
jgi:hypothetical protein